MIATICLAVLIYCVMSLLPTTTVVVHVHHHEPIDNKPRGAVALKLMREQEAK